LSWLLDTNVISEWTRPRPDERVREWMAASDENSLFLSAITFGEIWFGIERLPTGRKRRSLELFVSALVDRFDDRVLPIDQTIAARWGIVMRRARSAGHTPEAADGLIAATALAHGLTVVTRNTSHFTAFGVTLYDPWTA
jgi:predicted nucleic acid-binding protein